MNKPSKPAPPKLKLPEVVELLVGHFECTREHARDLVERAVHGGSLRDFTTHYLDGTEFPRDITAWGDTDWDSGIVMIESSWGGSPPQHLPVVPLFSREDLLECFGMDIRQDRMTERKRGGRPLQHDWVAFWIEVCRRVHEHGLPETQAELVDGMLDWFFGRGKEAIDRRTIEKKISKLFAVLRPD